MIVRDADRQSGRKNLKFRFFQCILKANFFLSSPVRGYGVAMSLRVSPISTPLENTYDLSIENLDLDASLKILLLSNSFLIKSFQYKRIHLKNSKFRIKIHNLCGC